MRIQGVKLLLLASSLALSACGPSGGTVNVRPPLKGQAPDLVKGLPKCLGSEQMLSAEFLEPQAGGTPATVKPCEG